MIMINLAENLRMLRKSKGMSQKQLADLLNVSQRSVSDWENKVTEPNLLYIAKLCEIFDESFDSIIR